MFRSILGDHRSMCTCSAITGREAEHVHYSDIQDRIPTAGKRPMVGMQQV